MTDTLTRIIGLTGFTAFIIPMLYAGIRGTIKLHKKVKENRGLSNTHYINFSALLFLYPFMGLRYAYFNFNHWGGYYFAGMIGISVSIGCIYLYLEVLDKPKR